MPNWHFVPHPEALAYRGATGDAFFAGENNDKPADSLVRESVQNSLGAHCAGGAVRVRFGRKRVSSQVMHRWFGDAWRHYLASELPGVGRVPEDGEVLVIEDFGTSGLEGDIRERRPTQTGEGNHFYRFFWAEALSAKSGQQGGRWGIGKTVFPRSSRLHTFMGLTVRESDKRSLLMGRTILNLRSLDGSDFGPDGHFGERGERFVEPVEDPVIQEEFRRDFGIARRSEPGLSVVVPYVDPEITTSSLVEALQREYFWPILAGRLSVQVDGEGAGRILDAESISADLGNIPAAEGRDLRAVVDFSKWAQGLSESEHVRLNPQSSDSPPRWANDLLEPAEAKRVRAAYRRGERLGFVVPLHITRSGETGHASFFRIYVQRDVEGRGSVPRFIRSDIFVPKARERAVRGHALFAVVVIEDEPLAAFLGDAEPPAHSKWSHQTEKFIKAKYKYGGVTIQFVCDAPYRIAEFLSDQEQDRDTISLADLFPQPPDIDEDDAPAPRRPKPRNPDNPTPLPPSLPKPTRSAVEVATIDSGFRIHRGDPTGRRPAKLDIRAAYDRSRGNPFAKYDAADFDLSRLSRSIHGAREVTCQANRLVAELIDDDFEIRVSGFDANRDVIVSVRSFSASGTNDDEAGDDQAE